MSIYQEYLNTRKAIEELQVLLKANEEACIAQLKESKQKSAKTELGTFSMVERKSYKFSDDLTGKEQAINILVKNEKLEIDNKFSDDFEGIKNQKENEIEAGKAEVKIAESFRFTAPKE